MAGIGLVPAPLAGQQDCFLTSDGQWKEANQESLFLAADGSWKSGDSESLFLRGDASWEKMPAFDGFPRTEAEFRELTWAEIQDYSNQCYTEGAAKFANWVGWQRTIYVSGYGERDVRLVALNNNSNSTKGFTFMHMSTVGQSTYSSNSSSAVYYPDSNVAALANDVWESYPDDLRNLIKKTTITYGYGNMAYTTSQRLWEVSYTELTGGVLGVAIGKQFDWCANTSVNFSSNFCLREAYTKGTSYYVYGYTTDKEPTDYPYTATLYNRFCFQI